VGKEITGHSNLLKEKGKEKKKAMSFSFDFSGDDIDDVQDQEATSEVTARAGALNLRSSDNNGMPAAAPAPRRRDEAKPRRESVKEFVSFVFVSPPPPSIP